MHYQEAIENHINECRHRVDVIRNHMNTNGDVDTDRCLENIQVLETVIFAMNELQMYKDGKLCLIPESVYSKQCTELDAYKQLGTLEEVREALEKAEKYHWHNLRENPDDLPKNLSGSYLFENKWGQVFKGTFRAVGDIKLFETHIYSKDHGGDIWLQYKTCNVVQWKEIEPFEED